MENGGMGNVSSKIFYSFIITSFCRGCNCCICTNQITVIFLLIYHGNFYQHIPFLCKPGYHFVMHHKHLFFTSNSFDQLLASDTETQKGHYIKVF